MLVFSLGAALGACRDGSTAATDAAGEPAPAAGPASTVEATASATSTSTDATGAFCETAARLLETPPVDPNDPQGAEAVLVAQEADAARLVAFAPPALATAAERLRAFVALYTAALRRVAYDDVALLDDREFRDALASDDYAGVFDDIATACGLVEPE